MKSLIYTCLVLSALLTAVVARASDPQAYQVNLKSVGNDDIDQTLKATSDLLALRKSAPVSPFGLIARARSDTDRLKTALESFGYYESRVIININGVPLTDPSLGDTLSALPKGSTAQVAVGFTLGTLYHLRRIDIDGEVPASINARETLGLSSGQPAVAAAVLAGGSRLLSALQEQGYAFAQVEPPIAYEAADAPVLDLSFHVVAGSKVNIGDIHIEGLQRVHESLVRRRLLLHTGDLYNPTASEAARRDLLGLNIFGQVSVQIGTEADESGGVPITFKIRERLRHSISLAAAFSSDLGGSGGATWTDRNLFGNAEQLSLSANVINLGGSDTTGTGYDTSVKYLLPEFLHRDQSLQFVVSAIKQQLQAYDQTAKTASATLSRKLSSVWTVSAGVSTTVEQNPAAWSMPRKPRRTAEFCARSGHHIQLHLAGTAPQGHLRLNGSAHAARRSPARFRGSLKSHADAGDRPPELDVSDHDLEPVDVFRFEQPAGRDRAGPQRAGGARPGGDRARRKRIELAAGSTLLRRGDQHDPRLRLSIGRPHVSEHGKYPAAGRP